MGPVTTSLAALVDCHACNRDNSRAADVRSDTAYIAISFPFT